MVTSGLVQPAHRDDAARYHDVSLLRRRDDISDRNVDEPCEAAVGVIEALDAGSSSYDESAFRDLHPRAVNGGERGVGETYIRVKRKGSGFTGSLFNGINALTGESDRT